jgi:hypothetical protein
MRYPHRASIEQHVEALIGHAFPTVLAHATGPARVDHDSIANSHPCHVPGNFRHSSGNLVPKDHRFLKPNRSKSAVIKVVQIGSANAADLDPDHDLSRPNLTDFLLLETQVFGGMNDECAHRNFLF